MAVRCLHCGARYETELPIRAIERIRRCSRCGHATLEAVSEHEEERAGAEPEPQERHGPSG